MKASSSLPLPPGNLGLPIIGETLAFLVDSQFAEKRHQQYGSIFKTRILGSPTIFVHGSEVNRFVLTNENKYFVNNLPTSTKTLLGSMALSVQVGTEHQNRRKLLYQAFQPRALARYVNTIEEITQRYLHKWTEMETLTWYPELRSYTFDIACKFLVGVDFAAQTQLGHLFEIWSNGLFSFSPPLPWTQFGRALRSRQQLLSQIEVIIRQRQQEQNPPEDTLSLLLQAKDESGNRLSLEELKDQVLILLFAGHETLTSALASFCLLLAQHPEVHARCRQEQQQLESETLTLEKLKRMTYLEQVLQEVLRLIPPVGGGFRKVISTCDFCGYQFPQGWNLIYQIPRTHLDNSLYAQAEQFDPERFNPERMENGGKPFSYLPFGGGLRECLGKEFARLEMKIFAALLTHCYKWKLSPSQNLQMVRTPVPHPQDGLRVNLSKS